MGADLTNMVSKLEVFPSYYYGFTFVWTIAPTFVAPRPWFFTVQESKDSGATWEDVSPELENLFCYSETKYKIYPKEEITTFRVKIRIGTNIGYTFTIDPYGIFERRIYLIAREITRKEFLQMKKTSGTRFHLYSQAIFAKLPGSTVDPITGDITDPKAAIPYMYSGPYEVWLTVDSEKTEKRMEESQGMGIVEQFTYNMRTVGYPLFKRDDVLVDTETDKRFYVETATHVAHLHGMPLAQTLSAREISPADSIFLLNGQRIEEARKKTNE